jgi:uncharacterized membrane-anchored protein
LIRSPPDRGRSSGFAASYNKARQHTVGHLAQRLTASPPASAANRRSSLLSFVPQRGQLHIRLVLEMKSERRPMMKPMLNKVPAVTLVFWLIKTLATTVGETAADFLNTSLKLGLLATSGLMALLLVVALSVQIWTKRYVPSVYWLVVVLISVVGTLLADNLVDNLGVSLTTSSIIFALAVAIVLGSWYAIERSLSVHTITTTRRELFYWSTILFTFSLGTSAGDLIAEHLGLGYAWSVVLFLALIGAVYAAWRYLKIDAVLAFWAAYILTRPLGASTGDLLSQSKQAGGLGLGPTWTSAAFLGAILLMVVFESWREVQIGATSTGSAQET